MVAKRPLIPMARPSLGEEEKLAVMEVLESGQLAQGPVTRMFESEFAAEVGTSDAIAVSSGTAALIVALQSAGVGQGDEVVTTPFSFIATATSIIACGATPVFVDVDPVYGNIDAGKVGDAIGPKTKAVMPVHLYGHPAEVGLLAEICESAGLALVEDAAQAHGARHGGKAVGSFGTGCFSFYPTKNMTTGEGGLITTNDPHLAEVARSIRSHGEQGRYNHERLGLNWRMTDIAAAIGRVQLTRLGDWNEKRIANATGLTERIVAAGLADRGVAVPRSKDGDRHVFHQYTVRIQGIRDRVRERLEEHGVGSAIHYPVPIHRQPVIRKMGFGEVDLPEAESLAQSVLSLPVHPGLSSDDLDRIVDALGDAVRSATRPN